MRSEKQLLCDFDQRLDVGGTRYAHILQYWVSELGIPFREYQSIYCFCHTVDTDLYTFVPRVLALFKMRVEISFRVKSYSSALLSRVTNTVLCFVLLCFYAFFLQQDRLQTFSSPLSTSRIIFNNFQHEQSFLNTESQ